MLSAMWQGWLAQEGFYEMQAQGVRVFLDEGCTKVRLLFVNNI
jgi:hypothetical protein